MDEEVKYDSEGRKMIEINRYIIDTTKDHMEMYNMVRGYIRARDNIVTDYQSILDSILTLAYKLYIGDLSETAEDLEYEIVTTYFSPTMPQNVLDRINKLIYNILEYYVKSIIALGIVSDRVMFLRDINNKGIIISEYNIEHLRA